MLKAIHTCSLGLWVQILLVPHVLSLWTSCWLCERHEQPVFVIESSLDRCTVSELLGGFISLSDTLLGERAQT